MSSNKFCALKFDDTKHRLSVVEKITGTCKWCTKHFCQQHSAVEQHACESYDRSEDINSANVIKQKSMASREHINRNNCAF